MSNRPHLALSQLLTCRLQTLADPKDKNRIERGRKIAARWGPGVESMNTRQLVEKLFYEIRTNEQRRIKIERDNSTKSKTILCK